MKQERNGGSGAIFKEHQSLTRINNTTQTREIRVLANGSILKMMESENHLGF